MTYRPPLLLAALLGGLFPALVPVWTQAAPALSSERPGNFFAPGEALVLTLSDAEPDVPVTLALLDYERQTIATLTPAPEQTSVSFPAAPEGFYRVEARAGDRLVATCTLGVLAPASPAAPDPSARFGTIAHLKRIDDVQRDRMLDLISRAGIGWIREGFLWHELEPKQGQWKTDRYDDLVARALGHGINVLPVLGFGADWASENQDAVPETQLRQTMPKLEHWENYVRHMVSRYGDRLHAWEIWNEPNLKTFWRPVPDARAYARLAARAYGAIKEIAPNDTVLTAGFATGKTDRPNHPESHENLFLRELAAQSPRPFDVIAYHPYTLFRHGVTPAETEVLFQKHFRNLLSDLPASDAPPPPFWLTEMGVSTIPRITTEEDAAGHLVTLLTLAQARGEVQKVFLYNFRDVGADPGEKEHMFGLIHNDYTPKPGYFAYRTFIATVGHARFVARRDTEGIVTHEFATSDGHTVQVLWSADATELVRTLPMPAGSVEKINLVGQSSFRPVDDRGIVLSLGASPVYLKFKTP